ncbi:MAG: O-antigen ligase family protein [Candidatus Acidiferrales bacterium]
MAPRLRWLAAIAGFALLGYLAIAAMQPFSVLRVTFVLLVPLVLVFVIPSSLRTLREGAVELVASLRWYHWLWLIVLAGALVFRVRDAQEAAAEPIDSAALLRIGAEIVVGLILLERLFMRKTRWLPSLFRGLIGIMAAFALVNLASTLWSVKPLWTLYKSLEYLLDLSLIAAVIVSVRGAEDIEKFADWTWALIGLLAATAWVGAVFDPADALYAGLTFGPLGVRLAGVVPNISSNGLGDFCAILAAVALCRLLYDPDRKFNRAWYGSLFAAGIVTLIFAQSRSSMVGLLISILLLLFLTRRVVLGAALAVGTAFAGIFALAFTNFGVVLWAYLLRGEDVQMAEGLTGRVNWWQYAFQKFTERPLTGFGGFAGGKFVILPGLGQSNVPDLHSNFVESLVDTGIWGPILLVIALVAIWWILFKAFRSRRLSPSEHRLVIEAAAVMAVLTVRSTVTGNIIDHLAIAFLTVLAITEFMRRRLKFGGNFAT